MLDGVTSQARTCTERSPAMPRTGNAGAGREVEEDVGLGRLHGELPAARDQRLVQAVADRAVRRHRDRVARGGLELAGQERHVLLRHRDGERGRLRRH
eukprot:949513-Rhodomonas_salina.3